MADLGDRAEVGPTDPDQVIVWAVLGMIEQGRADRWLHRLRGAVLTRAQTDEYQSTLIAGSR